MDMPFSNKIKVRHVQKIQTRDSASLQTHKRKYGGKIHAVRTVTAKLVAVRRRRMERRSLRGYENVKQLLPHCLQARAINLPSFAKRATMATYKDEKEKDQWLASDWDDPTEVAIVYSSVGDGTAESKCGHAVRW